MKADETLKFEIDLLTKFIPTLNNGEAKLQEIREILVGIMRRRNHESNRSPE